MKFVNHTPHAVVFCDRDGKVRHVVPPSGLRLECEPNRSEVGALVVDGIDFSVPETTVELGDARFIDLKTKEVVKNGLPPVEEGTIYLVSRITVDKAKSLGRTDFRCPDDTVRDAEGRVAGCKALAR